MLAHHLAEAAHVTQHHGLGEGQAGEQDAGDVDAAVRQGHHVSPPEERRQLVVGHVAVDEADPARGRQGAQPIHRHPERPADHPELRAGHLAEGLHEHVDALVVAHHAEGEHHRTVHRGELGQQRPFVRLPGEVLERAAGDHVHALARAEQLGPVARVHDHGVEGAGQVIGRAPPAPDHVVQGEHLRRPPGHQPRADLLQPEPLPVPHVGRLRPAPLSDHAGQVLGALEQSPQSRVARTPARARAVEGLADLEAVRRRHRTVHEAGRDQVHVGAPAGQGGGQRVVVEEHVGRRVDELHSHVREWIKTTSALHWRPDGRFRGPLCGARRSRRVGVEDDRRELRR